jgi:hypothetical protein
MAARIEVQPGRYRGRAGAWFVANADTSSAADLEALIDVIERGLGGRDMSLPDVVRTRLLAATREGRDAASKVRFRRFSGPARCATSSYIDTILFPTGDGVRMEGRALEGAGDTKIAVEYEPLQPPCRYVSTGDLVFLSGFTSTRPRFAEQLDDIRPRIAETIEMASARLGRPVRPIAGSAYVHLDVDPGPEATLLERLGLARVPLTIGRAEGYSAPGKLIEVEVDAAAGSAS